MYWYRTGIILFKKNCSQLNCIESNNFIFGVRSSSKVIFFTDKILLPINTKLLSNNFYSFLYFRLYLKVYSYDDFDGICIV